MRYLPLAAAAWAAMALLACNPSQDGDTNPVPSRIPSPVTPQAPSAPVVPSDPEPDVPEQAAQGGPQVLLFTGPMDLTIRLSTDDNFATAVMTIDSEHALFMRRVRSGSGIRMENGEGVAIVFKNGVGIVEFSPEDVMDIAQYRLP